jgi:hypothetical protein
MNVLDPKNCLAVIFSIWVVSRAGLNVNKCVQHVDVLLLILHQFMGGAQPTMPIQLFKALNLHNQDSQMLQGHNHLQHLALVVECGCLTLVLSGWDLVKPTCKILLEAWAVLRMGRDRRTAELVGQEYTV